MTAKSHPAAMRFIPDQLSREHVSKSHISTPSDMLRNEPMRYALIVEIGVYNLHLHYRFTNYETTAGFFISLGI